MQTDFDVIAQGEETEDADQPTNILNDQEVDFGFLIKLFLKLMYQYYFDNFKSQF